jgi:hypothetical protein
MLFVPKHGITQTVLLSRGWTKDMISKLTRVEEKKFGKRGKYTTYLEGEVDKFEATPEFQDGLDDRIDAWEEAEDEKNLKAWEDYGYPSWTEAVVTCHLPTELVLVYTQKGKPDYSQGFFDPGDFDNIHPDYQEIELHEYLWEAFAHGWMVFEKQGIPTF